MVPKVILKSAEGLTAVVIGVKEEETLAPAMVAHLDRRLRVLSPFSSGPPS